MKIGNKIADLKYWLLTFYKTILDDFGGEFC